MSRLVNLLPKETNMTDTINLNTESPKEKTTMQSKTIKEIMPTAATIFIHKKAFNWNKTFEDFLRMKPFNNQLKARLYNASVEYYLSNNTETEDRELIVFYNHGDVTTIFNYEYFEGEWHFGSKDICSHYPFYGKAENITYNPKNKTVLISVKVGELSRIYILKLSDLKTGVEGYFYGAIMDGNEEKLFDITGIQFVNSEKDGDTDIRFSISDAKHTYHYRCLDTREVELIDIISAGGETLLKSPPTAKQFLEDLQESNRGRFDVTYPKPIEEKEASKPPLGVSVSGIAERVAYLENLCAEREERIQQESAILDRDNREMYLLKELLALNKS